MPQNDDRRDLVVVQGDDIALREAIDALIERVTSGSDHPVMSEASLLAWRSGRGFSGLAHRDGGPVNGYAQVGRRLTTATIEIVVDPTAPGTREVRHRLLTAALSLATADGTTEIRYWVTRPSAADDAEALALGFGVERDLLQLRAPLPLAAERPSVPGGYILRTFRPGVDEAAWLKVNNRAFASHPEQGAWDLDTLRQRENAPWFDPAGFVLLEIDGRLAGSCWTKVHHDRSPVLGEIYVISVDPDFQGRGLGRLLAIAGLDTVADQAPVGMLYVEADNTGAVALYTKLGFTQDHIDRSYLFEPARSRPMRA